MPNVDLIIEHRAASAAVQRAMFEVANDWIGTNYLWGGNSKDGIDCSHFVFQVLNGARQKAAVPGPAPQVVTYQSTATIEASGLWFPVSEPQAGDLVLWDGHVGIVLDPATGTFVGAQSSTGVAKANYLTGYWGTRSNRRYLRFVHFL